MIKIGLTGSIAMGKSEVARILAVEGLPVFDADREVHSLYDSKEGTALLKTCVPGAVRDDKIDRKLLSNIVLADPAKLTELESIVHAEIAKRRDSFAASAEAAGHPMIVFDVPLLFEKSLEKTIDVTVVVSAPEALQRNRAMARNGMTAEKYALILARQMPDHEKRKRADYVIENNGTLQDLAKNTRLVLKHIKRIHTL